MTYGPFLACLVACGQSIGPADSGAPDDSPAADVSACRPLPDESPYWHGPATGTLYISEALSLQSAPPAPVTHVTGSFHGALAADAAAPRSQRMGACTLLEYNPSAIAPAPAGTIHVGDLTLADDPSGDYGADPMSSPWQPGDSIRVTATGGAFPGFDATLLMPTGIALVAPVSTSFAAPVHVPAGSDVVFRWTGGTPCGLVHATFDGVLAADDAVQAHCLFRARDGVGVVPAAVLAALGSDVPAVLGATTVVSLDLGPDHVDLYVENLSFDTDLIVDP